MSKGVFVRTKEHCKHISESKKGKHINRPSRSYDINKSLWDKVEIKSNIECWNWLGCKDKDGYGIAWYEEKIKKAHRLVYEYKHGSIPNNMCVLHKCDNPSCCNPEHLFLGTTQINTEDMVNKNRQAKGEKINNSKLTSEDIKEIRELYSSGKHFQKDLAKIFNVSQAQISEIIMKKVWKHI